MKHMLTNSDFWRGRLKASAIHLALSLLLALAAACLVFLVWYPYPYREISGGRELFLILVAVDVVMGPLMTLAVFNKAKPRGELLRDLGIIALLQLAALAYGLWTVAIARPVHLVFEIDRFRVIHAIDVPSELLVRAPPELRTLPLFGPSLISVRDFKDSTESFEATMAALRGAEIGGRPDFWQPYAKAKSQVLARAKPVADLNARFPANTKEIQTALQASNREPGSVGYIPMVGRQSFWTVLIDLRTAEVLAFVPIDSF